MMKVSPPPANYAVLPSERGGGEHRRFCREKVMAGRLLFADSGRPEMREEEEEGGHEGGWGKC